MPMFSSFSIEKIYSLLKYDPNDPLIFSTSLFLFLFCGFLILYNIAGKNKSARIFLLIIFSLYFYYKSAGLYFLILVLSAVVNFYIGGWIAKTDKFALKRTFLALALLLNIALLGYFKYTNFILQIIGDISSSRIDPLAIFLPIGIWFYTFKSLNYLF
ncbi:MAG: MBOAT family protein, partial [Melioribacteraceae bacterium]